MDAFIGQITIVGFNFEMRNWAFCRGQLIAVSQNTALFSLLGTIYGGDGRTTFALPDMRGRVAVGFGNGPGLRSYSIGQKGGMEQVALTINQIPAHNHKIAMGGTGSTNMGSGNFLASVTQGDNIFTSDASGSNALDPSTVTNMGGNQAHTNIQPFIAVNYLIAMQGIFPSRN